MIDPLTAATSVAGLLSISIQVGQVLSKQIHTFKNAPKDAHELLEEIESLRDVLASVETFLKEQAAKGHLFEQASVLVKAIRGCGIKITTLKEKLERLAKKQGFAQLLERGRWFLEHEEHVEVVTALHRYLGIFQISLSTNGIDLLSKSVAEVAREVSGLKSVIVAMTPDPLEAQKKSQQLDDIVNLLSSLLNVSDNVADVSSTIKRWDTKWQNEETQKILDWISPLNTWAKQQDTLARRQEGTCQWLFDDPLFQGWLAGGNKTLWCPGSPGAGKTILVSMVIDFLYRRFETDEVGIGFIYCNYKENQSTVDLIGALLRHVVARQPSVSAEIRILYEQHRKNNTKLPLDECVSLLRAELSRLSRAFIIVDALDEADEQNKTRSQLMSVLAKLPTRIQLLVTSRHVPSIEAGLHNPQCLEIRASDEDVRIYLNDRIEREDRLKKNIRGDAALRDLVIDSIAEKAQGMFLLAQLHIESISKKQNRKAVRTALESLPKELDQTYEEAMERILLQEEDDASLAKKVLSWISYARRPMTVLEIQHATAVELNTKALDEEGLVDEEILVSVCAGLVTIDQESNMIRLVHYTTQEWFERNRERLIPNAQTAITLTCLTYLSYDMFKISGSTSGSVQEHLKVGNPLLEYAARNWGYHAIGEPEQSIRFQILEFLAQKFVIAAYPVRINWLLRLRIHSAPPLCVAASFMLQNIALLLVPDKVDLEAKDLAGQTALHVASLRGQESLVQLLVGHGAKVAARDYSGNTPLHLAATQSNLSVTLLLLDHGAEVNAKNRRKTTPIFQAVEYGGISTVKLLLEHGAEVNAKNEAEETPLFMAAECKDTFIVKLLLEHGAEVNAKDWKKETSIFTAVENEDISMVKLLLEHGAKVNVKNGTEKTLIFEAVKRQDISMVKLLLEHGAEANIKNGVEETPIFTAVENEDMSMVKLLLEHGAKVNVKTGTEKPLIFEAVKRRDISIVKLLLEHGAEVNAMINSHHTVLHWVSSHRSIELMELLLEHGADVEVKDRDGDTPLQWTAEGGKTEALKLLLKAGSDPKAAGSQGTPLDWAIKNGHEDIIRILAPLTLDSESTTLDEALHLASRRLTLESD